MGLRARAPPRTQPPPPEKLRPDIDDEDLLVPDRWIDIDLILSVNSLAPMLHSDRTGQGVQTASFLNFNRPRRVAFLKRDRSPLFSLNFLAGPKPPSLISDMDRTLPAARRARWPPSSHRQWARIHSDPPGVSGDDQDPDDARSETTGFSCNKIVLLSHLTTVLAFLLSFKSRPHTRRNHAHLLCHHVSACVGSLGLDVAGVGIRPSRDLRREASYRVSGAARLRRE